MAKEITPRQENYSEWYNNIIKKAKLAEHSAVKGCMVIRPHGFAIWENMKAKLDQMFKDTGHQNAYFPLFIPKSFLSKEAEHVEGFAKECAVVTHYRLKNSPDGGLIVDPDAKLEEELIVRPTSETIIWNTYRDWIQSYRDLPLLINQWANVVRWEMRTRLFLRTAEFLWQEGHTAHSTSQEAEEETLRMLNIYADFAEGTMAMPVIRGRKTENERFPGAVETYCIESMMQDGKALQAGTSHFLGQNFAKAFDVKFQNKEGKQELVWATSWGVSTRLMGALIMSHSDDEGLVVPPKLAPIQVVMIPIYRGEEEMNKVLDYCEGLAKELKSQGTRVKIDSDDTKRPGFKFAENELNGVPIRIAVGPRDLNNGSVELARRDTREKSVYKIEGLEKKVLELLDEIQANLFNSALKRREENTVLVDTFNQFKEAIEQNKFVYAHWDGTSSTELRIKEETKATIRCIPMDAKKESGSCIYSGAPSGERVLFAKAY